MNWPGLQKKRPTPRTAITPHTQPPTTTNTPIPLPHPNPIHPPSPPKPHPPPPHPLGTYSKWRPRSNQDKTRQETLSQLKAYIWSVYLKVLCYRQKQVKDGIAHIFFHWLFQIRFGHWIHKNCSRTYVGPSIGTLLTTGLCCFPFTWSSRSLKDTLIKCLFIIAVLHWLRIVLGYLSLISKDFN